MPADYEDHDLTLEPDDWPSWKFQRYILNKLSNHSSSEESSHNL
jgi:hypothetical protein